MFLELASSCRIFACIILYSILLIVNLFWAESPPSEHNHIYFKQGVHSKYFFSSLQGKRREDILTKKSESAKLRIKKFLVVRMDGLMTTTVIVRKLPIEPKKITTMYAQNIR